MVGVSQARNQQKAESKAGDLEYEGDISLRNVRSFSTDYTFQNTERFITTAGRISTLIVQQLVSVTLHDIQPMVRTF